MDRSHFTSAENFLFRLNDTSCLILDVQMRGISAVINRIRRRYREPRQNGCNQAALSPCFWLNE